jgi:hypothetical protein
MVTAVTVDRVEGALPEGAVSVATLIDLLGPESADEGDRT